MKTGRKLRFRPAGRPPHMPPVEGTVIYAHPRGRFVLVEYRAVTMRGGPSEPLRECLPLTHGVADKGDMPKRGCHRNFKQ